MKRSFKEKIRRFLKIFTTVVGLFVLIPQIALAEVDHDCTGNDCVICEVIRTSKDNSRQINIVDTPTIEFENSNYIGETECTLLVSQFHNINTLISLKAKLSF